MKPFARGCRRAVLCRSTWITLAIAFAAIASAAPARADERPKWELGVGSVFYTQPDYVGSDEYRFRAIPFPWFVYRGQHLRIDREAIQAKIFGTDLIRLDLSASGQYSVDSDDNDRRHGMPDLDWIGQIGGTMKFVVARSDDGRHALDVDVPLRVAIAVDFDHISYEGLVSSPKLQYRYEPEGWRFEANAGLEFQSNSYNEFYYSVPVRFATAERPFYGADGGYSGVRLAAGASRYFNSPVSWLGPFYVGLFARYINLEGATFADSPLVGTNHSFVGGIAIGCVISKSDEMVLTGAAANRADREAPPPSDETTTSPAAQPALSGTQ
jgi:outer membrane scaffolding protein for murein synthesis (MipA/OmpV family)